MASGLAAFREGRKVIGRIERDFARRLGAERYGQLRAALGELAAATSRPPGR